MVVSKNVAARMQRNVVPTMATVTAALDLWGRTVRKVSPHLTIFFCFRYLFTVFIMQRFPNEWIGISKISPLT